jgi:hypothetical protein
VWRGRMGWDAVHCGGVLKLRLLLKSGVYLCWSSCIPRGSSAFGLRAWISGRGRTLHGTACWSICLVHITAVRSWGASLHALTAFEMSIYLVLLLVLEQYLLVRTPF